MCEEYRIGAITLSDKADYISRQGAINGVHSAVYPYFCGSEDSDELSDDEKLVLSINKAVCAAIKALPAEQSERKNGKWIQVTNGRGGFECNKCHCYAPSYQNGNEWLSDFCPNCGVRMKNNG